MSFIELLKNARSSPTALLHKFLTKYDSQSQRVHCFVEGEPDQAFYRAQVRRYVRDEGDIHIYRCDGKKEVYRLYDQVVARLPTCNRVLFFVDKDIDDIVGEYWARDPRIFITDVYSIENYAVCAQLLKAYLDDFVKVRRCNIDSEVLYGEFERRLAVFHKLMVPIMAWIVVVRRAGKRPVLNDVNLAILFQVNEDGTSRKPKRTALAYLNHVTKITPSGPIWRQVRAVCIELRRRPAKSYVRGKFEAWWFVECVRKVVESFSNVATLSGGSLSVSAGLNANNFIQMLSHSITTPPSLHAFLNFHLSQPTGPKDAEPQPPEQFARDWAQAASPSACPNTTPPEPPQGQALRAPTAALTRPRLRGQATSQEGDAANYARTVV